MMTLRLSLLAIVALVICFSGTRAEIIHVPGTWDTIAEALADAVAGDEIVIACGTYYERSLQMKDGVTIRSSTGDPSCVTIDAEQVSEVFLADTIGDTSVLEGLTISGGYAADGAGIHISDASPTIRDCVFIDNDAGWGGAMAVYYSSFPEITDCVFDSNESWFDGGAVLCIDGAHPVFTDCVFESNYSSSDGGALSANNCSVTLSSCTFDDNVADDHGGAVSVWNDSNGTVTDCDFNGNEAGKGGGGLIWSLCVSGLLDDCRFYDNTADYGGGLYCFVASPSVIGCEFSSNNAVPGTWGDGGGFYCETFVSSTFENCTFFENSAVAGGGAYIDIDCDPEFINCTFYRNTASAIGGGFCTWDTGHPMLTGCIIASSLSGGSFYCGNETVGATLNCCNVFGNAGGDWIGCIASQLGEDNFSADPLFCLTPPFSMFPQTGSPCLPGNHPNGEDCRLIGALGEDANCDGQPVRSETTWSSLKTMY